MRRMYSEQELTKVIKEVFDAELASGALDDKINDAVDAYLLENPVDITALEGQDVECASVTATGAGFSGVNARPLYWHTIQFQRGGTEGSDVSRLYGNMIIINQSATPIDADAFMALLATSGFYGVVVNGKYDGSAGDDLTNMSYVLVGIQYQGGGQNITLSVRDVSTNALSTTSVGNNNFVVTDLGANKLNA